MKKIKSRQAPWQLGLGANFLPDGRVRFRVWSPYSRKIEVKIFHRGEEILLAMQKDDGDYFTAEAAGLSAGDTYKYIRDGEIERPDPVSRFLPEGLHGPSAIIDPSRYRWQDKNWKGIRFQDLIFYELHIGTFTEQGTFKAAIQKIPHLKKLGITCVEIMPVSQFPGKRNWGYDGANLYAVQNSYGGPDGLKMLVDACHRSGLAVCLDVVYNHFGPEGNYLSDFGPYFTDKYRTPWGNAVNYDDEHSDAVREFIISNACYWVTEYHIDVLRLDAIHAILDLSARHLLEELDTNVREAGTSMGRKVYVIGESGLNDSRVIRDPSKGGYGLDGQWSDDFHHATHVLLTGEKNGYYSDFGTVEDLAKSLSDGFIYDGRYSVHRKKKFGNSVKDLPPGKLVVGIQNHDQVGNRAYGERLSALVPFEKLKLAAFILLLAPQTPLLFMGEEYGEENPFQYFIDHGDSKLRESVKKGRRQEFAAFGWKDIPDPSSEKAFEKSKLDWKRAGKGRHVELRDFYRDLISFRKKHRLSESAVVKTDVNEKGRLMTAEYEIPSGNKYGLIVSFSEKEREIFTPFAKKKFQPLINMGELLAAGKKGASGMIMLPAFSAVFGKLK